MSHHRKPFGPTEHLGAGAVLSRVRRDLQTVALAVDDAYGRALSARFLRLVERLDGLRSQMDNRVCAETPMGSEAFGPVPVTAVYYGWANGPGPALPVGQPRERLGETGADLWAQGKGDRWNRPAGPSPAVAPGVAPAVALPATRNDRPPGVPATPRPTDYPSRLSRQP